MYDSREKAIRDYQSAIKSAHREGRQEGWQEGRQEGERIGEQRGELIGEQRGEQRGKLLGKIVTLQEILEQSHAENAALDTMSIAELEELASQLQQAARNRASS